MKLNGFESVDWRDKEWSLAPILSPLGRDLFFYIRHLWAIPDGALAKRVVQERKNIYL